MLPTSLNLYKSLKSLALPFPHLVTFWQVLGRIPKKVTLKSTLTDLYRPAIKKAGSNSENKKEISGCFLLLTGVFFDALVKSRHPGESRGPGQS